MKYIYIVLFCCAPLFIFGQNFKFKIGGGLSYNTAFLNDRINENAPTPDNILDESYRWYFEKGNISSTFNEYRKAKPKIGYYVNGIGNLYLTPSISLRLGADFQYVRLDREINQTVATFGNIDDYQTTLKLHDITLTIPLDVFYISLPLGLEYSLKNNKLSFFGGVNFSARIFDKNMDPYLSRFKVRDGDNSTWFFTNPVMEEFFLAANLGLTYEIRKKLNLEISLLHGITNMLDTPFQVFRDGTILNTDKGVVLNKEKSHLGQLSVGVSYLLF